MKQIHNLSFLLLLSLLSTISYAQTKWWDSNGTVGNGVGGSATWGTTFSTAVTGTALTTAATTDNIVFDGAAGTVTLGTSPTVASNTFNVTNYVLTTSGGSTRALTGNITLANSVTLKLAPINAAPLTIPSVTGGTSSALSVTGSTSAATDAIRINLAGGTIASTAPITINTTGTLGISGFVSSSGTSTINASIANSTSIPTMIGATSGNTLNIGGVISGTAGVAFSAGSSGGAGTVSLNAAGTYTGNTQFNGTASGAIKLGITNGISTSSNVIMGFSSGNGQKLDLNGFDQSVVSLTSNGGTGSITNSATGTGTNTLTITGSSTAGSFGLVIADGATAKTALTQSGSGATTLSATNTYTGATTVSGGSLVLASGGSIASGSTVTVDGGTLKGVGTANGTVTIQKTTAAGIISPAGTATTSVPGTISTGALNLNSDGRYVWEINDVNGTYGTNYDKISVASNANITVNATSANPFVIDVTGFTAGNVSGVVPNFSNTVGKTLKIMSCSGTGVVTGFAANKFSILTSNFSNNNSFTGTWTIQLNANNQDIELVYTPATPALTPSVSSLVTNFTSVSGMPSASQSFTLTGTNLNGSQITIAAPTNFEVSFDNTNFSSSLTITYNTALYSGGPTTYLTTATLNATTIFARIVTSPSTTGSIGGTIDIYGGSVAQSATTPDVSVTGSVTAAQPTTQAHDIAFSNVNPTSFDINWTNGDGASRIVVVRLNATINATPSNGSSYLSSNADITTGGISTTGSSNYVVYNGNGNYSVTPLTITGLTSSSTYSVQVYEYNGSGGAENYLTTTATVNPNTQLTSVQQYYWDAASGAGNGVGGNATWGTTFSTASNGSATLVTCPTTSPAVFQGTAGTITLGGSQTALSNTFNTTGYTVTTSGTATRVLAGNVTLANNVTLNVSPIAAAAITIPSINGGTNTALNIGGANAANGDATRINLTGGTIAANSPISITTTGTLGISGFVGSSGTSNINANISNSSNIITMLGATSGNTLNIGGIISGTAGLRFAAGSNGGAGTINLNQPNTYTGSTSLYLTSPNGTVKLGATNALPATTLSFGNGSAGIGGKLDLNGFDETIGDLSTNVTTSSEAVITNNATGTSTNILTINQAGSTTFSGQINDGTTRKIAVVKTGAGTLKMNTSNTFTGGFTVTQGTFQLGNGNIIPDNEAVTLNGGTIKTGDASNSYDETMGVLTLGANSTIAFSTSQNRTLAFANSAGTSWTGTLTITGWNGTAGTTNTSGPKIKFGTDPNGLDATQLSQISFTGYNAGATILSNGEVVPASANLIVDQSTITSFGSINVGSSSTPAQYFDVSGTGLGATITITPITGYEISLSSGSGFITTSSTPNNTITINTTGGILSPSTRIYVRFSPLTAGTIAGNITVSDGSVTQNVAVTGTGALTGVYSVASGNANTAAIWSNTTNGTGQTITALGGFNSNLDVTIQSGTTVTVASSFTTKNLTVAGTLKNGLLNPTISDMQYVNVFGNIACTGDIGNGATFDALGFNIEGPTCDITGIGTNNFNIGRIRKSASTNLTSTLNLNKDIDVWYPGTAIYNNQGGTSFDINVGGGKNIDFHNVADLSIDGTTGFQSSNTNYAGTITVNGSITNINTLFARSNNTNSSGPVALNINNGGLLGVNTVTFDRSTGTGNGVFNLNLASGSTFNIYTGLELRGGTFTAPAGANVVLKSTAANNYAYIDNFTTGYTGTYTGNITIERFVAGPTGSNQHFIGSPVTGATLSAFGANNSGGQLVPKATCDETEADPSTPNSKVFEWRENVPNSTTVTCPQKGWFGKVATDVVSPAKGYSAYLTSGSVISVTGSPNIDKTAGAYQVTGLANSNWNLNTLQSAALSFPYKSGYHLVSNPYPNAITLSGHTGFDDAQIYNPTGPFAGTFSTLSLSGGTVAPFQAFYVHVATGQSPTWTVTTAERTLTTGISYRSQNSDNALIVNVSGNGFNDATSIEFNDNATAQFDAGYDSRKLRSNLGQPTLYTWSNNEHLSHNINRSIDETPAVPLGLVPGANGTFTFNFDGINTFDPTSYIYLEDIVTGVWTDVRQNPTYTFTMNETDNQLRFVMHFTPAIEIATTDVTCSATGSINITQPGNSSWLYTLTDGSTNTISSGALSQNSPITVAASNGVYTLTLTSANGYVVMKNIIVSGTQPVSASFNISASTVSLNDLVDFTSNSTGASSYDWNFGDGTILTNQSSSISHQFVTAGVYTVMLSAINQSGCQSTATQQITVTQQTVSGVSNVTDNGRINIWSSDNKLFVDFTQQSKVSATIEVYNVLGQQISNDKFNSDLIYAKQINNLEAAYVFVRVKNEKNITTKKVFISNK